VFASDFVSLLEFKYRGFENSKPMLFYVDQDSSARGRAAELAFRPENSISAVARRRRPERPMMADPGTQGCVR